VMGMCGTPTYSLIRPGITSRSTCHRDAFILRKMATQNDPASLRKVLERQRAAFQSEGPVTAATRIDRIQRVINLLVDNEAALCGAMSSDFGYRPHMMSRMTDILPSIRALKYARTNVEQWMVDDERPMLEPYKGLGGTGFVRYQPKGVVGNISPWNAPINVAFSPVAGMLAAGNRVMIKPSEFTPATAKLLHELVARYFDETEIAVVEGGPDIAHEFASLPFDHLLFTGSTAVGQLVLAAAAKNLVPVTLELGGKSPVIVGRSASIKQAADRIVLGKLLNAGQVCLSPDYLLVPRELSGALVDEIKHRAQGSYPDILKNPDYCAIINERHRDRLDAVIADARSRGAEIVEINETGVTGSRANIKRALTLILNPHDNMKALREEMFGPILPIVAYDTISEAIAHVNARPRPLGLYYFGNDPGEESMVLARTISGGVTVNDVLSHVVHEQLPFGGIGPSGMGAYHGVDGFRTFSHARSVYRQTSADLAGMAGTRPPYGATLEKVVLGALTK
jgi:coniferyl-aldehyde dehydrogenase